MFCVTTAHLHLCYKHIDNWITQCCVRQERYKYRRSHRMMLIILRKKAVRWPNVCSFHWCKIQYPSLSIVPFKGGGAMGKVMHNMWALREFCVPDTCWGARWEAWTGTPLYTCCPSAADAERCWAHRRCTLCGRTPAVIRDKKILVWLLCESPAF